MKEINNEYQSPYSALPTMEDLVCGSPENGLDIAIAIDEINAEMLTIESASADLENMSVRTLMEIMGSDKNSAKDRLAAVKETTEILGKKKHMTPNVIAGTNVQVNQLTSPEVRDHLLSAAKDMQVLSDASINSIDTATAGRG